MGISMKQKIKAKILSETVFHIVVLISIDTCITVLLQIYTSNSSNPGADCSRH